MTRPKKKVSTKRNKTHQRVVHLRITFGGLVYLLLCIVVGVAAVRTHMPLMFILFGTMIGTLTFSSVLAVTCLSFLVLCFILLFLHDI